MNEADLLRHVTAVARWLWDSEPVTPDRDDPLSAIALFSHGEPEPTALGICEIRGCTVSERAQLTGPRRVVRGSPWNAGEFTAFDVTVLDFLMPEELEHREHQVSQQLVNEWGLAVATAQYMEAFEHALRNLPWHERWPVSDDFVLFQWDPLYGEALLASLRRGASDEQRDAWAAAGLLP